MVLWYVLYCTVVLYCIVQYIVLHGTMLLSKQHFGSPEFGQQFVEEIRTCVLTNTIGQLLAVFRFNVKCPEVNLNLKCPLILPGWPSGHVSSS